MKTSLETAAARLDELASQTSEADLAEFAKTGRKSPALAASDAEMEKLLGEFADVPGEALPGRGSGRTRISTPRETYHYFQKRFAEQAG